MDKPLAVESHFNCQGFNVTWKMHCFSANYPRRYRHGHPAPTRSTA
ncbi:hypothetical protein JOE62_001268 [Glutamicibacter nicotianae]|nr:hypothetical protein [Glutamicibacter nicotianae]